MSTLPPEPKGAAKQSPAVAKPRRSRGRVWLFRLLAILLGLVPIVGAEFALRYWGKGQDLSLVIPYRHAHEWYQLNPRYDQAFYGLADLSGPEPRPFQLPKSKETVRILVVGGSTVVGFPYPSELSFVRHLEIALQAQASPSRTVEVLNAGITAMNSSTEVAVVEDGLKTQPDVIVVYTGHNEFYAPGGVASTAGVMSPHWYRTVAACRRLYLVQALRRWMKPTAPPTDLIESLPGNVHIPQDSEMFRKGLEQFKQNLTEMARLAKHANVPILFVSPVANEHDQPPIEDLRALAGKWSESLKDGERELAWGDPVKALELLESARREQEQHPLIRFRLAQAYERNGRASEAIEQFDAALTLDGCRFRASSAFRNAMADVATEQASDGVTFLDLHRAMSDASKDHEPGRTHFLEHVHFTWEGNRFVGQRIAKAIVEDVMSQTWNPELVFEDAALREVLGVQDEDHLAANALAMMLYQKLPFRDGADAAKLGKDLIEDSLSLFRRLPAEEQKLFEERTPEEMAGDLMTALIRASRRAGNDELLGRWLKLRVVRQPWRGDAVSELQTWLLGHGLLEESERLKKLSGRWPGR